MNATKFGAVVGGALAAACAVVIGGAALALRPVEGEWSIRLGGPHVGIDASVPTLIRWATHPLARAQLDGRTIGGWHLASRGDGAIEARCAPCRWRWPGLGNAPVHIDAARIVLHTRGADAFDGTLHLGAGDATPLVLAWRATLAAGGVKAHLRLAPTPLARVITPFAGAAAPAGAAVPEARRAAVHGTVAATAEVSFGPRGLAVERLAPVLEGIEVHGLGTEALADVDVRERCRPQPAGGRVEGWIRNAVIAAEDHSFLQHPGYDVAAWQAAWKHNATSSGDAPQGASTITMQLAKILYTGDERSAARKLREWLYAVEMERTLGKARILQLYLALLPWGDGVCGAEAAARHHLGKSADQLKPREAAWLASLLINPDAQLRRWSDDEAAARARVAAILHGMRRLSAERRDAELEALATWRPPVSRLAAAR